MRLRYICDILAYRFRRILPGSDWRSSKNIDYGNSASNTARLRARDTRLPDQQHVAAELLHPIPANNVQDGTVQAFRRAAQPVDQRVKQNKPTTWVGMRARPKRSA